MTEQEEFECFGIPPHVWIANEADIPREPAGWSRRGWVHREVANLGVEAIPSPPIELLS
jgi:hypothetical protein